MQEEQQEEKQHRVYKINIGDKKTVFRKEVPVGNQKYVYYSIGILKTEYDGTKKMYYKPVKFKRGTDIPDKTKILIKNMFEDVRDNPKDQYNPIWSLFILDYEIVEQDTSDVIKQYQEEVKSNNQVETKQEVNIEDFTDDMLPF